MIRILLVDDQKTILYGLKALLETHQDFDIVGLAENGQEAIDKVKSLRPDVALIDMYMPVLDGAEATKVICQDFPEVRVLLLSASSDESLVLETIKAGAKGYLLKNTPPDELATAIRSIRKGFTHFGPGVFNPSILTTSSAPDSKTREPIHQGDDISSQLEVLFDGVDELTFSKLDDFVQDISTSRDADQIQSELDMYMKKQPDHWKAWYLASALQHTLIRDSELALKYSLTGFDKAVAASQFPEVPLIHCHQLMDIAPSQAQMCYARLLKQYQTDDRTHLLMRAASNLFSNDSSCYQYLLHLWQIRELDQVFARCQKFQMT